MLDLLRKLFSEPEVPRGTDYELTHQRLEELRGIPIKVFYEGKNRRGRIGLAGKGTEEYWVTVELGFFKTNPVQIGPIFPKGTKSPFDYSILSNRIVEDREGRYFISGNIQEKPLIEQKKKL